MDTLTKPRQLRICLFLMIVMLAYGIINGISILMPIIARSSPKNESVIYTVTFILGFSLYGFIIYKIHNARSWARIIWSLLFIFETIIQFLSISKISTSDLLYIVIEALINVFILFLLWHQTTTRWFNEMKIKRIKVIETPPVETLYRI